MAIVVGVLFIIIGLYVCTRMRPAWFKTVKKKTIAIFFSKVMWRLHLKCEKQKRVLFRSLTDMTKRNGATPHILEIGVGTSNNFAFYPQPCTLSCVDPNCENRPYVLQTLLQYPGIKLDRFLEGFAENMEEFKDNTFDAVVCTFTLCSVRQQRKVVSEIKRVLKPGGSFFFLEHVAAGRSTKTFQVQDWLEGVWRVAVDGCRLTSETGTLIQEANFSDVELHHFEMDGLRTTFFLKPCLFGVATK